MLHSLEVDIVTGITTSKSVKDSLVNCECSRFLAGVGDQLDSVGRQTLQIQVAETPPLRFGTPIGDFRAATLEKGAVVLVRDWE